MIDGSAGPTEKIAALRQKDASELTGEEAKTMCMHSQMEMMTVRAHKNSVIQTSAKLLFVRKERED
eukprot:5029599-Pleurochrysis_carterae.AAC.1